ncbi:MAG: hypothetical protein WKG01_20365 [Kofleriaceae bacterium]
MTVDLELTVLSQPSRELGILTGFAVTDQMIVAVGGTVVVSSDARTFERRPSLQAQRATSSRAALAIVDQVWTCGDGGQLAVSRDHGATWTAIDTGTRSNLHALALAGTGALWVVGAMASPAGSSANACSGSTSRPPHT